MIKVQQHITFWHEWIVMGITSLLLLVGVQFPFFQTIQQQTTELLVFPAPAYQAIGKILQEPLVFFRSKIELQTTIRDLQQKYAQALVELAQLESLKKENKQLKELVTVIDDSKQVRITTPLVSYAQPSIVGGIQEGIKQGSVVVWSGQLFGVVTEVGHGISRVSLLQDTSSPRVLVKTETGVQGILHGTGKVIELTHVPVTEQLKVEQRVLTIGQEGIPAGLLVGIISQVKIDPADPIQSALISQPMSFFEQDVVEIR